MEPIPLRTVRPFVIDEVVLIEAAEDENFDVTNQIEVGSYLKKKVCSRYFIAEDNSLKTFLLGQ